MTKLSAFLLAAFLISSIQPAKAQISIYPSLPQNNELISDSLVLVYASVTSTYEISSVKAVTDVSETILSYENEISTFMGQVNLAGVVQGVPHYLKFIARDVMGNEKTDSILYTYVLPPKGTILSPVAGANAWPSLHIKTSHSGVDTITSIVKVTIGAQTIFIDTVVDGDIDTTIAVSSSLNGHGTVSLSVKNKWNLYGGYSIDITADSYLNYLYLTPVYTGTGKILSYKYNKILEAQNDALYVVDSGFQSASAIPGTYTIPATGSITPYGAVWPNYEWTNGNLYNKSYTSLAGKWGTYTVPWSDVQGQSGYDVYRRNLEDRSTVYVARLDINGGSEPVVAANGSVIYFGYEHYSIGKYNDVGGNTTIEEAPSTPFPSYTQFFAPVVTNGDSVLYKKYSNDIMEMNETRFYNGTSSVTLSNMGSNANSSYSMAGKYIAYDKLGTTGQRQIWLRDSTGNSVQKTFFGSDSYIAGLTPSGDLMFVNGSKVYYLKKDSINAREIGNFVAYPFYRDSAWYVIKNSTLYKLNINAFRTVAAGNWSSASSWQYGTIPLPNADVIVDTNIIVDTDVICNTIKVIPPGSIIVLPGINLTVLH